MLLRHEYLSCGNLTQALVFALRVITWASCSVITWDPCKS